jgi:hypothetical protein
MAKSTIVVKEFNDKSFFTFIYAKQAEQPEFVEPNKKKRYLEILIV